VDPASGIAQSPLINTRREDEARAWDAAIAELA
jgi:hypothetical protein